MKPQTASIASDYHGLVAAIVQRRKSLGWSQAECDHRTGLADGYQSKVEQPSRQWGRILGPDSLPCVLQALGLRLIVVPADKAAHGLVRLSGDGATFFPVRRPVAPPRPAPAMPWLPGLPKPDGECGNILPRLRARG
jgi:hypothetical protein